MFWCILARSGALCVTKLNLRILFRAIEDNAARWGFYVHPILWKRKDRHFPFAVLVSRSRFAKSRPCTITRPTRKANCPSRRATSSRYASTSWSCLATEQVARRHPCKVIIVMMAAPINIGHGRDKRRMAGRQLPRNHGDVPQGLCYGRLELQPSRVCTMHASQYTCTAKPHSAY